MPRGTKFDFAQDSHPCPRHPCVMSGTATAPESKWKSLFVGKVMAGWLGGWVAGWRIGDGKRHRA